MAPPHARLCRELRPHYEQVERELPVAGQDWPWGYKHRYPFSPHPVSGAAAVIWRGALAQGIEMRAGPVGIVNGTFGNRPHCIYRGYCLQGCKVNAKASPYVTHLPDALAHDVEIRADCMALRIEIDDATGRALGVVYAREPGGPLRWQRARAVAVAGYSIETPRLLLASTSRRFPHGLGNGEDGYIRSPPSNSPVTDVTSKDMTCNVGGATVASKYIKAAGGDKLTFEWHHNSRDASDDIIDLSHKGPVMVYMAPTEAGSAGNGWVKIAEDGYADGTWAVETPSQRSPQGLATQAKYGWCRHFQ